MKINEKKSAIIFINKLQDKKSLKNGVNNIDNIPI